MLPNLEAPSPKGTFFVKGRTLGLKRGNTSAPRERRNLHQRKRLSKAKVKKGE